MASITFLGTGGGRYVLLSQKRYSGGLWLDLEAKCILDPGPGALIRALEFGKDPEALDLVLVSHKHLDHYNDAELMIEAMTGGMNRNRGTIVLNKGASGYISDYHKSLVNVIEPEPGKRMNVSGLEIEALPTHNHAGATGFKFISRHGVISCTADTAYKKELVSSFYDSDILILNTIFPASKNISVHLNSKTAAKIIKSVKPRLAIIQHFGKTMLAAGPGREASRIQEETGVRTIAAVDGMSVNLGDLSVSGVEKAQQKLDDY